MISLSIIGSRGIPAKYGGFETFVEKLCLGLPRNQYSITVVCDAEQRKTMSSEFKLENVNLVYSRFYKQKNPLMFYLESVFLGIRSSSIIYCCGAGAGYFSFIPKFFGKTFIVNPDGVGWKRAKWNLLIRSALRSLFRASSIFSEYIVCDSRAIKVLFNSQFKRSKNIEVIEYGTDLFPQETVDKIYKNDVLKKYGLSHKGYHLVVSRLEPENNVSMIIDGYIKSRSIYPLVIVGNLQNTSYVNNLKSSANNCSNIIFLGGIYNSSELKIVRSSSITYLHGHSVGGTNPSLLEAMGSQNLCICHDNEFNREVMDQYGIFFSSASDLAEKLSEVNPLNLTDRQKFLINGSYERARDFYNWNLIVKKYDDFFKSIYREKNLKHL